VEATRLPPRFSSSDIKELLRQKFALDVVSGQSQIHPGTPSLAIVPASSTHGASISTSPTVRNHRLCDLECLYQALPRAIVYAEDSLMPHLAILALLCYCVWF